MVQVDDAKTVIGALFHLPEDLRGPIELCFLGEKTKIETGEILGISRNSVRRRLHEGLLQLRKILESEDLGFGEQKY